MRRRGWAYLGVTGVAFMITALVLHAWAWSRCTTAAGDHLRVVGAVGCYCAVDTFRHDPQLMYLNACR